jgi:molybdopterin converting factor small subunit
MTIRALFFARYREIAGTDALDVELPAGASASELVHRLRAPRGAGG